MNSVYTLVLLFTFCFNVNSDVASNTFRNIRRLRNCRSYEPRDYTHRDFYEIDKVTNGFERFKNNTIKFQSFILSRRDVNIFLSTTNDLRTMEGYDIHVGVYYMRNNTRGISVDRVRSNQEDTRMALNYVENLWENGPRKIDIEIKNDGQITVQVDDKEVLETFDSYLFDVKYVSFVGHPDSYHLVMYNCTMPKDREPTVVLLDGSRVTPPPNFYKHDCSCE